MLDKVKANKILVFMYMYLVDFRDYVGAEHMTTCPGLMGVSLMLKYVLQCLDVYGLYRMSHINHNVFCCK